MHNLLLMQEEMCCQCHLSNSLYHLSNRLCLRHLCKLSIVICLISMLRQHKLKPLCLMMVNMHLALMEPGHGTSFLQKALGTTEMTNPHNYVFLCRVDDATALSTRDATSAALALAVGDFVRTAKRGIKHIDHFSITQASGFLALVAQKNIQWKKALAGPDRDKAIAAFHAERDSLMSNILELSTLI